MLSLNPDILDLMVLVALASAVLSQSSLTVLDRTHSHNDYLQKRPLLEALDNGFSSVEADVFLVDGKLLVAHDRKDLRPERTLDSMYLQPIAARMTANDGWVYPGVHKTFWVLIDIKADGLAVYGAFKESLSHFPSFKRPNICFVMSGDRPVDAIVRDKGEYSALDGRWGDLDKGYSRALMPWVSEDWSDHFKWNGSDSFSAEMREKLVAMVQKAHEDGRRLRFWGAPDNQSLWDIQWRAGVDILNTDHIAALRSWMLAQGK